MEQMLFIEHYTVKKSIVSFFNYLRNRRPVVKADSPARLSSPSIRFLSSAVVKPHQAGEAYVNFATTTALKIIWRLSVGSPWLRSTLSACIDCTQRHVTSRTCSLTDRWFVTVIPSIFIDVTRWMSVSGGGGQTVQSSTTFSENDLQRLLAIYLQIISRRPLLDIFKLSLTRTYVDGWNHNVCIIRVLI